MNEKFKKILTLFLILSIIAAGISLIGSYIKGLGVNTNRNANIKMESNFLQMQLEDAVVSSERNFIGKLHFETMIPEDVFEAKNNTKSKFVKNWFSNSTHVLIKEERNSFVNGDFNFTESIGYEGDDYSSYKERFNSEVYFNENGYKLNVPWKAIGTDGKIKEDYTFNFVITVQALRMTNDTIFLKSGVIIEYHYEFKFNVINNGIIKFQNEDSNIVPLKNSTSVHFREWIFGKGKEVAPFRNPFSIIMDFVKKITKS